MSDDAATDSLPMTPVSRVVSVGSISAPSVDNLALPQRKLTIRVPVEYAPLTPPSSAELPAIPLHQQRTSLHATTPVPGTLTKRASAPASGGTWVHVKPTVVNPSTSTTTAVPESAIVTTAAPPSTLAPIMPTLPEVVTPPTPIEAQLPITPGRRTSLLFSMTTSISSEAGQLPTPPHEPSRPRRKSGASTSSAGTGQGKHVKTSLLKPPPTPSRPGRMRTSPSHVSLIDFSSSEEEGDDDDEEGEASDVGEEHLSRPARKGKPETLPSSASVSDADGRWAPEPLLPPTMPYISPAASYSYSAPSGTATTARSQSRAASSVRSASSAGRRGKTTASFLGLTAMPTELVQRDVDYTLRALMSPELFKRMLDDPLARMRFREFLAASGTEGELDFWTDARFLAQEVDVLKMHSTALRELHMSGPPESRVKLSNEIRRELLVGLQRLIGADVAPVLGRAQGELLDGMYQDHFQRYIKHKIIQETHVTLGKANLFSASGAQGTAGLGDAFVLTNPRLPDHPIVLASDGFVEVTGYPRAQIVGRNCRFLQGPGTPPASVQRIRDGLNSGKGCTELLLNYRRNGEPFYCLLCIIPVRDTLGNVVYFIGGQANVTGLLATDKGAGALLGGGGDSASGQNHFHPSPALALLHEQGGASTSSIPGRIRQSASEPGTRLTAAGAVVGSGCGSSSGGGGGFLKGLFGRTASMGPGKPEGKQVIAGAEAMITAGARGLGDQYSVFQNTYNKVLIFKAKKREITFVSPQMLTFLGLPTRTQRELVGSVLIRSDVASLLTAASEDRNETRRLREEMKDAVRRGVPCSLYCGVKVPGKGILTRNNDSSRNRFGMMHVTPLKDGDNAAAAFVAIFG
ncbi:hypothetical protein FB45DRAFT_930173 [Roridomyces roridus]|uniref:RGS domain-containing protein n=1 Tax=Roridomyces roridus TaxID=1738132 RepID=A0AAD7FF99_9AGAR|nr:hypothetical protein FB45DRAFT_930173 [Roridomyces roridus]